MTNILHKAHEKLLNEMKTNKSPITERLHVWLCKQRDEELLSGVLKEDRTIHKATEYCYAKGSKIAVGGVADVTDDMEREWCKEYYLKDFIADSDLKILPQPSIDDEEQNVVEVEKIIYKEPSFEDIGKYLDQVKETSKQSKTKSSPRNMSLFDES